MKETGGRPLNGMDWIIATALVVLALALRAIHLDANQLSLDEPFSVFHAQMGLRQIIENLKGLNNPPLNEIILHFWIRIFGISPVAVRIPALIFGSLNIGVLYLTGQRFFNNRVAVLSSLLMCFSNYHLYFSQEARIYALFALLTSCSFFLYFLLVRNQARTLHLVLLYLVNVLLIFSHYFGVAVIFLQMGILMVLPENRKKTVRRYLLILAGVILTYSVYIPEIFSRFMDSAQQGTWLKPVKSLGNLFDLLLLFSNRNRWVYLLLILILWGSYSLFIFRQKMNRYYQGILIFLGLLVFIISYSIFFSVPFFWKLTSLKPFIFAFLASILLAWFLLYIRQTGDKSILFLSAGWFLLPLLIFFGISFYIPVFLDRYLIFIFPAFCLIVATAVAGAIPPAWFYPAAGIVVLPMLLTFHLHEPNRRDIVAITEAIKERNTAGAKVYICPDQFKHNFTYYYDQGIFSDYKNFRQRLDQENIFFIYSKTDVDDLQSPGDSAAVFLDARGSFLFPDNGIAGRLTELYGAADTLVFMDSMYVYFFPASSVPTE